MGRSAYNPDTAGKYLIRIGERRCVGIASPLFYWLTSLLFEKGFERITTENHKGGPKNDCSVLDLQAFAENCSSPCHSHSSPVCLVLHMAGVCIRCGAGTGQPASLRLFGVPVPQFFCGRRHHLPGSGLFGKSFWAAYRRVMAVGQDSRTSVLDSGKRL